MFVRESVLSQTMIRIQILPVMGCTQRDSREVRGLLTHPSAALSTFTSVGFWF